MEKTDSSVVLRMDVVWSNIGLWLCLWDINKKDYNVKDQARRCHNSWR